MRIVPGPPSTPPAWTRRLGRGPWLDTTRQWHGVTDGSVVAGAIVWTGTDRSELMVETCGDEATAILQRVCDEVDGRLFLTLEDVDPLFDVHTLRTLSFEPVERLVAVTRDLRGFRAPRGPFVPRSFSALTLAERHALIGAVQPGDRPGSALYAQLVAEAGCGVDVSNWAALTLDGQTVGAILPQPDLGSPTTGALALMGLLPDARGRGLGRSVHTLGLHALARLGVETYVDHTESDNHPMRAIFARNGCTETATCTTWRRS